jgi:hypothetical protein
MNETIKYRVKIYCDFKTISVRQFEQQSNLSNGYFKKTLKHIYPEMQKKISDAFPDINIDWLNNGNGAMLNQEPRDVKFYEPEDAPRNKRLIPIYGDAVTAGGSGDLIPGSVGGGVDEWIDSGDWFKGITGAIRHYGESMVEYPKGCILALKKVQDRRLIVPGKDYVIETTENRVTKKVQLGSDGTYIRLHSTNNETYPDGTLIHQPYNVLVDDIERMFEVLGYVVKKGGGTMVYTN